MGKPRAAVLYSVVASAMRHDLYVWAYLREVLERLTDAGESAEADSDLAALLPDVWAQSHPEAIRTYRAHERDAKAAVARTRRQQRRILARTEARLQ